MSAREPVEVLVGFDAGVWWADEFLEGTTRFSSPPRYVGGVVTRCSRCALSAGMPPRMRCVRLGIPVRPDFFCAYCERGRDDAPAMHRAAVRVPDGSPRDLARRLAAWLRDSWKGSARNEEGEGHGRRDE